MVSVGVGVNSECCDDEIEEVDEVIVDAVVVVADAVIDAVVATGSVVNVSSVVMVGLDVTIANTEKMIKIEKHASGL